jgi:flagellar basal body L-ring protein FlgH
MIEMFGELSVEGAKLILTGCDHEYLPRSEIERAHEIAKNNNVSGIF